MQVQKVYVKTRAEFGKQCIFDDSGPTAEADIKPNPELMNEYIMRPQCNTGVQNSARLALHEVQTMGSTPKNTGMFHTEGGWPKEINLKDEEATARYRRRVEKDDNWAPKLRNLFSLMENSVRQNNAVDIYEHYFDDMIPTRIVESIGIRTVNVFSDRAQPTRPVSNISWSPDCGRRIVVSYCSVNFGEDTDYSHKVYIWEIENSNKPYLELEPFCPSVVTEYNPRDPSVLCSGLMSGQVCSWDTRVSNRPIQISHRQFSHRGNANAVKWVPTKSNSEFFSVSTDGCAMWWDTRKLREPTEILIVDLEQPNEPDMDRAIGVSCLNFGPGVGTKFVFGLENGIVVSGSKRAKSNSDKLSLRFEAHSGPVLTVDRNVFNPGVFLTIGDWTARIWSEDTREGYFAATEYMTDSPTAACWNKSRHSMFFVTSATGFLTGWDLLCGLHAPVLSVRLCSDRLTCLAPHDEGEMIAIGNSKGKVFFMETAGSLQIFDRKEKAALSELAKVDEQVANSTIRNTYEVLKGDMVARDSTVIKALLKYFDRSTRYTKAVDTRTREMKVSGRQVSKVDLSPLVSQRKRTSKPKPVRGAAKRGAKKGSEDKGDKTDKSEKLRQPSIISKTRSIKSLPKDPKRFKEFYPEISEAEDKFFEISALERDRLQENSVLDIAKTGLSSSSRRQVVRKTEKKSKDEGKKSEKREKLSAAQAELERKKRLKAKAKKIASETFIERRKQRLDTNRSMDLLVTSSTDVVDDKGRSKKKHATRVVKVCKPMVCKPKICCRKLDTVGRTKSRGRVPEGKSKRPPQLLKVPDRVEEKPMTKMTGKGLRILRKMLRPPTLLDAEVAAAKIDNKTRSRYYARRFPSTKLGGRVRGTTKSDKLRDGQTADYLKLRRSKAARKKAEAERTLRESDSPRDRSTSTKMFASAIGANFPILPIEAGSIADRDHSDAEHPQSSGVYPRISDVHITTESR